MIFRERKIETGFTYDVEDIFGEIHIESSVKLAPDVLDEMVVVLLRQNCATETVTGEVQHKDGIVRYTFHRASQWEDDEKNICNDSPTSTSETASECIRTRLSKTLIWSWCARFAEAFRTAWRSACNYQPAGKKGAGDI